MPVAVIDIGSNSVRLLVAGVKDGVIVPLKTGLVTTRLGQGMEKKRLLPAAMERTERAIGELLAKASPFSPSPVMAAATSAVRDAENGSHFVDMIKRKHNLEINVLSGKDEARLTYKGVLAGLNIPGDKMVVMDLGGGSTEFIWPGKGKINWESVNVGAVRATEGQYDDQKIMEILVPVLDAIRQEKTGGLVGVGGTVTNLSSVSLGLWVYDPCRVHGTEITLAEVQRLLDDFTSKTLEERKTIPGLQPERADIIVAGARIVLLIMKHLQIKTLRVSEADILYGLALVAAQNVDGKNGNTYQK